jgi:hypothetical protein
MRYKRAGWYNESYRHYLAAKGVKTAYFSKRSDNKNLVEMGLRIKGPAQPPKGSYSGQQRTRKRKIFDSEEFLQRLRFSPEKQKVMEAKYRKQGLNPEQIAHEIDEERKRLKELNLKYVSLQHDADKLRTDFEANKVSDVSTSISALEKKGQINKELASNPEELRAANEALEEIGEMREDFKKQRQSEKELKKTEQEARDIAGVGGRGGATVSLLASSQLLTNKEQYYYKEEGAEFKPLLTAEQQKQMASERKKKLVEELQQYGSVDALIASGNSTIPKEVLRNFKSLRSRSRGGSVIPGSKVDIGRLPWSEKKKKKRAEQKLQEPADRERLAERAAESQLKNIKYADPYDQVKLLEKKYAEEKSKLLPKDARRMHELILRAKENVAFTNKETNVPARDRAGRTKIKRKSEKFTPWGEEERKQKKQAEKHAADAARQEADFMGPLAKGEKNE